MKWPSVSTIRDFFNGLKEVVTHPGPIPPHCLIDNLPMRPIGYTADGDHIVYECARGHTFSPGVNVGDRDKIIEKSKGDTHGEI